MADPSIVDPSTREIITAWLVAIGFVLVTRLPVSRPVPIESDEFGFLELIRDYWLPMHHTLFLTLARVCGSVVSDPYRGFILLDMLMSALALVASWWWLRSLTGPKTAAAATLLLGLGPMFWGYGAVAGNYTAILFVGSVLLGIAIRSWKEPQCWHPFVASAVLAFGAGYRSDIGTMWLPVFGVILWKYRWRIAIQAGFLFVVLNLAWFLPMLVDVGGWARYREVSARFAHSAGYLNSFWNLGFVDSVLRYAVKMAMALLWTLGPALLFVPRGMTRLRERGDRAIVASVLALSVLPALVTHLFVHFGSPGYAFHEVPALLGLIVLGVGPAANRLVTEHEFRGAARLTGIALAMGLVFWCYPTNYDRPGWRGSYDLAFARHTRAGLRLPMPGHSVAYWRTANSVPVAPPPRSE